MDDPEAVAREGAAVLADAVRDAVEARGRCTLALSGGRTPWAMLSALAGLDVPWPSVEVLQVDERIVPADSPARNLKGLREALLDHVALPEGQVHPMPVEAEDPEAGAAAYARTLERLTGRPPVLDVVHLGLGVDGHTASLLPNDPILDVSDRWVATTGPTPEGVRMSLTYPVLRRARTAVFVVTGRPKARAVSLLARGDTRIPAGRIENDRPILVLDTEAAWWLECALP